MIKLIPIKNQTPYYHVIFNYMIGDANGNTTYDFICNESEIEKVVKYVSILNKLKPLKDLVFYGTTRLIMDGYLNPQGQLTVLK